MSWFNYITKEIISMIENLLSWNQKVHIDNQGVNLNGFISFKPDYATKI